MNDVVAGLAAVRSRIDAACSKAGRAPGSVRLLAVSKGHAATAMRAAYAAGQREFGESYVQEWKAKRALLADLPQLRARFIGRLQRNKVKEVLALGCAVDSLDSEPLAAALGQRAEALGTRLEVMLQVNLDRELQKAGVPPEAVEPLCEAVRGMPALSLVGLMTIPRAAADPEHSRPAFAALRGLGARLGLRELSMGMSDDLEVAIEEGATIVRVGTAIFGVREAKTIGRRDDGKK